MTIFSRVIFRGSQTLVAFIVVCLLSPNFGCAQSNEMLSDSLKTEGLSSLVEATMERGDATRGAILFHQAHLQCAKCHATSNKTSLLGPNLAKYDEAVKREYLLESILEPSLKIREGYQTVVVITEDGRTLNGILTADEPDFLVIRDASSDGSEIRLEKSTLEDWTITQQSLMPAGLVNQLGTAEQFYDLARYVIEVAEQGVERADELQPPQALTQLPPLPDYENDIDHQGMILALDDEAFKRGQEIYGRVCANCHGTQDRPGSLPTAPRFTTGKLKNGNDPYRLYQTLTHGYGMMVPQRWMVPQQKYDVIHYIREAYFKPHHEDLYARVEQDYLSKLPEGSTRGPEPLDLEPYITMDYGPSLIHTYEIELNNEGNRIGGNLGRGPDPRDPAANPDHYFQPGEAPNFAYKGIAVRLDPGIGGISRGSQFLVFDHDTLNVHAGWSGKGFIDYCCIQFDGRHGVHNRLVGTIDFENPVGPGWAHPLTGSFADPRPVGRDGRPYGPLPWYWARYRGLYHHGQRTILSYSVGAANILEMPGQFAQDEGAPIFTRQFTIGKASHRLTLRVAPEGTDVLVRGDGDADIIEQDGFVCVVIPKRQRTINLEVMVSREPIEIDENRLFELTDLNAFTSGGPPRWPERVRTNINTIHDEVFAVDQMSLPFENPWNCQVRATGHDFFEDGKSAAVCTWDGDVWIVEGVDQNEGELVWQRIASGLFQPLGLKILDGQIYVTCRDQIVTLRDLNGDREADFYQCFNNDHQVTEHFHEFAMGLQADEQGNLYYAKSARHAKRAVVPHHGTLLRVHADGSQTDIIATGFRAANGVCLNPDGTFFVTDQEGHWNPKNRINWVREGRFYGNMYGFTDATDSSDDAMEQPLCWITNSFDRSPAELLWVPKDAWGQLGGSLLNLSYGYGKIYIVPHQQVGDQLQGGMCQLPIPLFPSGSVRGRFHPQTHQLFVTGMFSWAGSRQAPGSFNRVRYNGVPSHLPVGLEAAKETLSLTLADPVDRDSVLPDQFKVKAWDLKRTANYGSQHFNERELPVESVSVSKDGRTIRLSIPALAPTWGMSVNYGLRGENGRDFEGEIHNSIFELEGNDG
ncbi:MAG: heme-binding protein [Planctomycetaceae bacterium]|nr:heme-binding protein [Planctomycetaceae bacterium]